MKKISICFITHGYFPMQGLTYVFEDAKELVLLGNKVYIISCSRQKEKKYENIESINIIRIPIKAPLGTDILGKILFSFLAINYLNKIKKINIVHLIAFDGSFMLKILGILFSNNKVKWVYDIQSGSVNPNRLFKKIQDNLTKFESKLYDGVFIIDNWISYLSLNKNTFLGPLGVDLELFQNIKDQNTRERYGIKESDIVFIYIGSLTSGRKIDEVLRAFSDSVAGRNEVKLLIVGDGPEKANLVRLARSLRINEQIIFVGSVDYREIPKFLSASDVGISYIPINERYDGQPPKKTAEYLACDLPVIATNTKGNQLFIKNNYNGILLNDDVKSFSDGIKMMSQCNDLKKILTKNARDSVKKWDSKNIAKHYILPVYKSILNDREK